MVSKSLEKQRVKGRKNRVTIDDKYMGREPYWDKDSPPPALDDHLRSGVWSRAAHWYNYFSKPKDYVPYVIKYAEEVHNLDKKQMTALKGLPDWKLNYAVNSVARLHYRGWDHEEHVHARMLKLFLEKVEEGKLYLSEKKEVAATAPPVISPAQRSYNNMMETIHADWDEKVVDSWMDGKFNPEFNVYELWKIHGLKGNVINAFREKVKFEYDVV